VASDTYLDPSANANGYRDVDPSAIDLSLQKGGSDQVSTDAAFPVAAGDVLTTLVAGYPSDGRAYALVTCRDGKTSPNLPILSDCRVDTQLGQPAHGQARFADFLADGPGPVDLCIKYQQTPNFGAPIALTAAADGGVDYGTVTPYLSVHAGFNYNVRFVAAGSSSCATAAIPEGTLAMPLGAGLYDARVTLALAGYVNPPDGGTVMLPDAGPTSPELTSLGLTYAVILDADMANGSSQASALRMYHLAATYPQPVSANNGNWSFSNVPYGGFGTPAGIDNRGYLPIPVGFGNPGFSTGDYFGADAQQFDFDTMYVVPGPQNGTIRVVYCRDSAYTANDCTLENPEAL
jgi:hypothetical protein